MSDSKFFSIPFGTSGDRTTIPEATQPSGAVSYTQGFGPDYERDPTTDPLYKPVPRNETNELYYEVTNAIRMLQFYGHPEWYSVDDAGNTVSYPISATVRYDAGSGMQVWRSIAASNTATPGSDVTKWVQVDPFSEATLAQVIAAASAVTTVTPRRIGPAVQQSPWVYAVADGTANAVTGAFTPAVSANKDGVTVRVLVTTTNTDTVTFDAGPGALPVVTMDGSDLIAGDWPAGAVVQLTCASGRWRMCGLTYGETSPYAFATQAQARALVDEGTIMSPARTFDAVYQARATLASATTVTLASVTAFDVQITGSVTIGSFGVAAAGVRRRLTFAAALTLTHSASLQLPNGGSNISIKAGDSLLALSLGGGVWAVTHVQRYTPYATQAQAIAGTLDNLDGAFMTPRNVSDTLNARVLGMGQTLVNVTGSRSSGVTYQNTTGRPITATITSTGDNNQMQQSNDGVNWIVMGVGSGNSGEKNTVTLIIPDGGYYRAFNFLYWIELR